MNGTTEETDPHDNELGFIEPSEPNSQSSPPTTALSTMVSDSDNTYGFDQGGITSYVVTPEQPEVKVIDALVVVPEKEIIVEGKKKKRLFLFGGISLLVIVLLAVILGVALTLKKRGTSDPIIVTDDTTENPTQAPSAVDLLATESFAKVLLLVGIQYGPERAEQFEAVFSNTSVPQYRAAAWVANSFATNGIIDDIDDDRLVQLFSLATFYFATNGDEWIRCGRESTQCDVSQEWLTGKNECNWYGITCSDDDDGRVTKIFFPSNGATSNNIRGTLPFEISFLSQLSTFILSRGPLSGEFPDWSKLSTLEQVLLNNNHLEGSFPTYLLAQNPLMNIIQFNNNTFEGEFLQDLSSIDSTALTDLSVNGNNFTGPIPSQIDKLSSLKILNVGSNGFTGTLPEELYTLSTLATLDLSNTKLRGELSIDVGGLSKLISFRASNTQMSGTLPTQLFSLTNLWTLDLSFGDFTGSLSGLPFSDLTDLDTALLSHNRFTGTIPSGLENLPYLKKLELHDNDLSGSIPEELCDRRGDGALDLQILSVDCLGDAPEVSCTCCTNCPLDI